MLNHSLSSSSCHGCFSTARTWSLRTAKSRIENCHGTEEYRIRSIRVRKLWRHTGSEALALVQFGLGQMGFKREETTLYIHGWERYTTLSRMLVLLRSVLKNHDIKVNEGHKPLASEQACTIQRHYGITGFTGFHDNRSWKACSYISQSSMVTRISIFQ